MILAKRWNDFRQIPVFRVTLNLMAAVAPPTADPTGTTPLESLLRRSEKRTASVFLGTSLSAKEDEKWYVMILYFWWWWNTASLLSFY
jgi:hypothetical protein